MGIHWQELVIVLLIVLLLFGPKRLPEIGRSMGNGIREFRDSFSGSKASGSDTTPIAVEVPAEAVETTASPNTGA
jgi:sec-independent protein translocase protein TatA